MSRVVRVLTKNSARTIEINGITLVGGVGTRGIMIENLAHRGDYVVLSPTEGGVQAHPLRGDTKTPLILESDKPLFIDDLILLSTTAAETSPQISSDDFWKRFSEHVQFFAERERWEVGLEHFLKTSLDIALMQQGVLIAQNEEGQLQIKTRVGLSDSSDWLSESVVRECLQTQKPILVQNVIGSAYEKSQSLVSHKFLSVICWPLSVRGESIGALFLCSRFPHPGLATHNWNQLQSLVQLSALAFSFHLKESRIQAQLDSLKKKTGPAAVFQTDDSFFTEQLTIAKQVAPTDLTTLVLGETGVGKEKLARWIHEQSERRKGEFVAINCGAIPSDLLESLLFGHKKGAFTGAYQDQRGKFELAHRGTLFLDEVGELPPQLQVKLLRVLQEKMIDPIGAKAPIPVDVRVIAATHRNLRQLIEKGQFREDLYYRLAEVTLVIPPLRARPDDIAILAAKFLSEVSPSKRFSFEALNWLETQEWQGNVRELQSSIRRAALLTATEEITPEDFRKGQGHERAWLTKEEKNDVSLQSAKGQLVVERVRQALIQSRGHRKNAASILGITPRTLFRYLEQYREELKDLSLGSDRDVTP